MTGDQRTELKTLLQEAAAALRGISKTASEKPSTPAQDRLVVNLTKLRGLRNRD